MAFPVGYLFLSYSTRNKFSSLPFFVRLPIYLSLGLTVIGIISYFTVIIFISRMILLTISLSCLVVTVYLKFKRRELGKSTLLRLMSIDEILPLFLLLLLFLHFSYIIGFYRWPPVGDLLGHGRTISMIIYRTIDFNRILFTYSFSFHAVAANFAVLLDVYPGESAFIFGAAIVILIPLLLYAITIITTGSKVASLIPFLGSLIYSGSNLERWFVGYFYNGPYPNLWGFLIVFTFFGVCCLERLFYPRRYIMILFLITFHLYLAYVSFTFFNIIYMLYYFLLHFKTITRFFKTMRPCSKRLLITMLLTNGILLLVYLLNKFSIIYNFAEMRLWYSINLPNFTNLEGYTVNFLIVIVAILLALVLIIKRIYANIAIYYLIISITVLSTLHPIMNNYLFFILPSRSLMIAVGLSWIFLALFVHHYISSLKIKVSFSSYNRILSFRTLVILSIIVFMYIFLPIYHPMPMKIYRSYGWFILSDEPDVLDAMEWIHRNVPSDATILGDASFGAHYLFSLSVKGPFDSLYLVGEFSELRLIWKNPENKTLVIQLIKKYNVKYIFVTSEWGWWESGYKKKPRSPIEYIRIFDSYDFLRQIFKEGDTAVYNVIDP